MPNKPEARYKKNKKIKQYAKYSGLPFQLFGLIVVFAFIGYKLDAYFQNTTNYITACLILLAFAAFMYKLFVMLKKEK